jgi:hypothetical protein
LAKASFMPKSCEEEIFRMMLCPKRTQEIQELRHDLMIRCCC